MNLRRLLLLVAIGFVVGLIATTPARLVSIFLPGNISLDGLSGTLWNGSARQLVLNNAAAGELEWEVKPSQLLTGRLGLKFKSQLPDGSISGNAAISVGGSIYLDSVKGSMPLGYITTDFPPGMLDGRVSLIFEEAIFENEWPTLLKGVLAVGNLVQNIPKPTPLGTFSVTFDGEQGEDGSVKGVIETRSGALQVDGLLTLNSDRSFVMDSMVRAKAETPDDLKSMLPLIGEQQPDGGYPLRYRGKL
ncbi:MAG: type II secretion system protein N [Chromatiales bacterium]|nr:type II secretion system protein N [Chromatiales bacterium]